MLDLDSEDKLLLAYKVAENRLCSVTTSSPRVSPLPVKLHLIRPCCNPGTTELSWVWKVNVLTLTESLLRSLNPKVCIHVAGDCL